MIPETAPESFQGHYFIWDKGGKLIKKKFVSNASRLFLYIHLRNECKPFKYVPLNSLIRVLCVVVLQWDYETWPQCYSWTYRKWKIFVSVTLISKKITFKIAAYIRSRHVEVSVCLFFV